MSDVVYLYGFVPPDAPAPPADVGGLAGAPVHLLDLGTVCAAISHLPAHEFGGERVEARLQDLGWVGEQGLAHERVVVWFADTSEILPARMFSIYSSEDALKSALHDNLTAVTHTLRSLTGLREWNLKVAYDAAELARHGAEISDQLRRVDEEIAAAPPGRRYLLERRRADMMKREVSLAARSLADELFTALRAHAADARVLPLAAGDETGAVVLNAALLVPRHAEADLRSRAEELYARYSALGMVVGFSGPWAPYRFLEHHGDA